MSEEKPQPQVFAIMRNAHEGLRGSIKDMDAAIQDKNLDAFRDEWKDYQRGLAVHMHMEDGAFFKLLNERFENTVVENHLSDEHEEDHKKVEAVEKVINGSFDDVKEAYEDWKEFHNSHLEHEEKVMMPLTQKLSPDPQVRAQLAHDYCLVPLMKEKDCDWYVGWIARKLVQHKPFTAVRVWAWAIQYQCSQKEWNRFRPVIKENVSDDYYQQLCKDFGIDGPGKLAGDSSGCCVVL